jgi:hypothetical protein
MYIGNKFQEFSKSNNWGGKKNKARLGFRLGSLDKQFP